MLLVLLDWNLTCNDVGITPWNWKTFFGVVVVALWKDYNKLLFSQTSEIGDKLWNFDSQPSLHYNFRVKLMFGFNRYNQLKMSCNLY